MIQQEFNRLNQEWQDATEYTSSQEEILGHPAYQKIIDLGSLVVPLILQEMQSRPDFWFHALRCLTGKDPTTEDMAGNMDALTDAWLRWGEEQGYNYVTC